MLVVKGKVLAPMQTRTTKGTSAKGKVRRGKATQALARYNATQAKLITQGKPLQALALTPPTTHKSLPHKASPPTPIPTKQLLWCVLQYTVQVWGVGTARYTTQYATLRGYVLGITGNTALCYIPRNGANPPHTVNASLTYTGLTPYTVIKMQG